MWGGAVLVVTLAKKDPHWKTVESSLTRGPRVLDLGAYLSHLPHFSLVRGSAIGHRMKLQTCPLVASC